jgi:hypothetical protein
MKANHGKNWNVASESWRLWGSWAVGSAEYGVTMFTASAGTSVRPGRIDGQRASVPIRR